MPHLEAGPSKQPFDRRHFLKTLGGAVGGLLVASALPEIANSAPSDSSQSPRSSRFPGLDRLSAFLTGITRGVEMRVGTTTSPYATENGSTIEWANGVPGRVPNPSTSGFSDVRETVNGVQGAIWQIDSTLQVDGVNLYRTNSHVNIGGVASGKKADNSEVGIYATVDSQGDGTGKIRVQGKDVGSGSQFGLPANGLLDIDFPGDPVQGIEVNEANPQQKYVVLTYSNGVKRYLKLDSNLRASETSWKDTPPVIDPTSTPTRIPTATPTPAVCKAPTGSFKAKQDKEDLDMTLTARVRAGGRAPSCTITSVEWDITKTLGPDGAPPYSPSVYRSQGSVARFTPSTPGIYHGEMVVIGSDGQRSTKVANFIVKAPKVRG